MVSEWMMDSWAAVRAAKLSPPVASRIYAYVGLALYEAGRHNANGAASIASRFHDFPSMPTPSQGKHDWRLASSAAAYAVVSDLFADENVEARAWERLVAEDAAAATRGVSDKVRSRSFDYGYSVGLSVVEAAATDGFAETRTRIYSPASGPGAWEPTGPVKQPLEPFWGDLRGFSFADRERCRCPAPPEYSASPSSELYKQARVVYDVSSKLTTEQATIAKFWADAPGETGTPPGHWLLVARKIAAENDLGLAGTSLVFALVHTAVADAFIAGWREKYAYNLLRPVTFIQRHIDDSWQPLISTPPFPEYISGHSVGSAAAASVLTALFGEGYAWQDDTASDRGFSPRHFDSFTAAANEAAMSRLYGGIHFPVGNTEGLMLGECIGAQLLDTIAGD
jgi:hypothetical protein